MSIRGGRGVNDGQDVPAVATGDDVEPLTVIADGGVDHLVAAEADVVAGVIR